MRNAHEAKHGVEQREESCDPERIAEPVPVEQRIPTRLVGERSVVVGRDTRLQERA